MFDRFRTRNNALNDESIQWVMRLGVRPSAGDKAAFERWRQRSPAHAEAARQAFALLDSVGHTALAAEHRHWVQALTPAPRRISRRAVLAGGLSAAALAGVVGTGMLGPVSGVLADHRTHIGSADRHHWVTDRPPGSTARAHSRRRSPTSAAPYRWPPVNCCSTSPPTRSGPS